MSLNGKNALVTGSGSGIGRALAQELSGRGVHVFLVGRRLKALEETAASLPNPRACTIWTADVTKEADRARLIVLLAETGRLDILINNAGVVESGPVTKQDPAKRRSMVETNLLAPMELTIGMLPYLHKAAPSRIVNVGSMFGDIGFPYFAVYSATKFGLRGWSESLRRELLPAGIGVTYVAPRGTATPAADGFMDLVSAFDMHLDTAEKVAKQIVDALQKGARDVYPKGPERIFVLLQRLAPKMIDQAMAKQFKKALQRLGIAAGLVLSVLNTAAWASELPADKGWYIAGKGGPSYADISSVQSVSGYQVNGNHSHNIIGAFGMSAGYEWTYAYHIPLRTELEFMNRTEVTYNSSPSLLGASSGALASTVQNITAMAKAYWYVPVGSRNWWPFVSGGVGWSQNTVKSQFTPSSGTSFRATHANNDLAWSPGFGATFKLGPQVMNDVEIRYVSLGAANWGLPAPNNLTTPALGGLSATDINFAIRVMF